MKLTGNIKNKLSSLIFFCLKNFRIVYVNCMFAIVIVSRCTNMKAKGLTKRDAYKISLISEWLGVIDQKCAQKYKDYSNSECNRRDLNGASKDPPSYRTKVL